MILGHKCAVGGEKLVNLLLAVI